MSARFEEIGSADTPVGSMSLRCRFDPVLDADVVEVKLGDEFLMSSLFTVAEVELARLALAGLPVRDLDVVVGGLGLGYTADAVLDDDRVASLIVVDAIEQVVTWHEDRLIPDVERVASDPRCRLVHGDFFEMAGSDLGFDPDDPGRRFDAVLVDIDHTPRKVLDPSHADFYTVEGLTGLRGHLREGGVFALWSDDPPDTGFVAVMDQVFDRSDANVVEFDNPYTGGESSNTVYLAWR